MIKSLDIEALVADLAGVREVAGRYAGELRGQFGPRLKRVRLFGSAARGDWTKESDIDVLVLMDELNASDYDAIIELAYKVGMQDNELIISPLPLSEDRFNELKNRERRLALDIENEGMEL